MLHLEWAYAALALLLLGTAWLNLRQRHWAQAAFWAVIAILFACGNWVLRAQQAGDAKPAQIAGIGVLALALLAPAMRRIDAVETPPRLRQLRAGVLEHWLFMPALLIPGVTLLIALFGADLRWHGATLFVASQQTLMGLSVASLIALLAAWRLTRAPAGAVLLIHGFYVGQGIDLQPLHIALWALPTAIAAFVIHAVRVHFVTRAAPRRARTAQAGDDHAAS